MAVVGQAQDGLEAVTKAKELHPHVVVMDVNMPLSDGLEATRLIRQFAPDLPIVMLTIREDDETLFAAIRAGANGYMLKNTDTQTFLQGIRAVMRGEAILPPLMASKLLQEFALLAQQKETRSARQRESDLTAREREVLGYIAEGLSDKEIGRRLTLSVYTIKSHVRNILKKLHAENRWQAARLARDEGILNDEG